MLLVAILANISSSWHILPSLSFLIIGVQYDSYAYTVFAGEYLALTGERLNGVDMLAAGLATHYSMSAVCSLQPLLFLELYLCPYNTNFFFHLHFIALSFFLKKKLTET